MAYWNSLSGADLQRYSEKLKVLHGGYDDVDSLDPFQMPSDDWIDNISRWPSVEFGEIYTYLIDTAGQFITA